jgi:hypothetical protein
MRAKVATLCCGLEYRPTVDARTDIQRFNTKRLREKSGVSRDGPGNTTDIFFEEKAPSSISFGADNRGKRYLDDPRGIHTHALAEIEPGVLARR